MRKARFSNTILMYFEDLLKHNTAKHKDYTLVVHTMHYVPVLLPTLRRAFCFWHICVLKIDIFLKRLKRRQAVWIRLEIHLFL